MPLSAGIDGKAARLVAQFTAMARGFIRQDKIVRKDDLALTRQEVRLMVEVGERQACTMSQLAKLMMLSVSSLTTLVDKLAAKNLARRVHSEEDRRVVRVALTAQGRRLHEQFRRHRLRMARTMLEALADDEQDVFLKLMTKIGQTAGQAGSKQGVI
jgi:DNA-binding MarR family transcriptional regulator